MSVVLLAAAGCSGRSSDFAKAELDANVGGQVQNSDGVTLIVPPHALKKNATATIAKLSDGTYDIKVSGELQGSVQVRLPIPGADDSKLYLMLHKVGDEWRAEDAERVDDTLVATVTHLSPFTFLKCVLNVAWQAILACLVGAGLKSMPKSMLKKVLGEKKAQEFLDLCYNPLSALDILFFNDCKVSAPGVPSGGGSPPVTGPSGTGRIDLARGSPASAGYWYAVNLTGFTAGSKVTVTCRDSANPSGFWTQTFTIGSDGRANDSTLCYSADGRDHWVTGGGSESNHISWSGGSPASPQPPTQSPDFVCAKVDIGTVCVHKTNNGYDASFENASVHSLVDFNVHTSTGTYGDDGAFWSVPGQRNSYFFAVGYKSWARVCLYSRDYKFTPVCTPNL